MRKLASIQRVEEILPIENAEAIQKARVLGWWVVIKRDQFKPGDLCIYIEVDSLLPPVPQFSFFEKGNKLKKSLVENGTEIMGWRLKSIRLRGQISQGLIMPLSEFPNITATEVGTDITEVLSIYKYDPPLPACLMGDAKGYFPGFIPKTDELRIQSFPDMLEKYRGKRLYLTTKIDGTSCTVYKHEDILNVCGRTINFYEDERNAMWSIANRYNLKERLPDGYALQAECAGEGISDNRHQLKGQDLYIFYVFDINKFQYLMLDDMIHFVKDLGMKTVPILNDNFILNHTVEELLKMADQPCPLNPKVPQEGIVFRLYDSTEKLSFKAISNEYLLKYGL